MGGHHSQSIAELWRRWHISLSTWFRDYVYIPFGGNRVVRWHWYYNLMLTFLLTFTYLFENLAQANRLNLDLPDRFPELYTVEYSYDAGHMNRAGVTKFSAHFAQVFREFRRAHGAD